jgi:acetyltransferase-like isoleucine patch superfamily enzyme
MRSAATLQAIRIAWYRRQWSCERVEGRPRLQAPALLAGAGRIGFESDVTIGWQDGPGFLAGYTYIEARGSESLVSFGQGTHVNNGATIVSEGPGIAIGRRCLIGPGVHIYDSDFHPLAAAERGISAPRTAAVRIDDDVFIGSAAIVLKGVSVGAGSVVGAGAVVITDVPADTIVAGNPARELAR